MVSLSLPWPPSVNVYWRAHKGRVLLSRAGREYRVRVGVLVQLGQYEPMTGDIALHIQLFPPDARRRDIDNTLKAILDSLEHVGIYKDDSQVACILIERKAVTIGGRVDVRIYQYKGIQRSFAAPWRN